MISMRRLSGPAVIALIATLGQPAARGQSKPDLPKAETVLNQYIEATGGKAAYEKIKNPVSKGTNQITRANLKGTFKLTPAIPNQLALVTELGPVGVLKRVTDGKNAWEVSTAGGERELDGEEKETFLREANLYEDLLWTELFAKVECVGIEDVEGKPAYKVVLTPKLGKPITKYYDKTSHLLVKETSFTATPMGDITVDEFPSDYKAVDGVLIPFTATQKVSTQQIILKMTEIKHNVDLPADAFRRPAAADEPAKKKAE